MNSPRVAVIMACYNSDKYLSQTISSILSQSYASFHVIAGNDGSTDKTADILEAFRDRITVVSHSDCGNHGQGATYNLCLNYANAEFIAFVDSDDLWHPDKISRQVQILDEHAEAGLVYTNGNVIDHNSKVLYPFFSCSHRETNEPGRILLDCYIRTPTTVMVRSSILRTAGAFTEEGAPDHDMWIRIKELTDFYYIKDILFSYRVHPEQFSRTSAEIMWENEYTILERAISRHRYPRHLKRQRLAVLHYRRGELYLRQKKAGIALYHFLFAFAYDPSRTAHVLKQFSIPGPLVKHH